MHILKELLENGHRVRVITRSQSKGEHLRAQFPKHASSIDVSLVSDQLKSGAYDEATKDIEAVIHTASPFIMNAKDNEEELIKPAIIMTMNMLNAAQKSPTVKRVILTSSIAAIVNPFEGALFADTTYTSESWNPVKREQAEGPVLGYLASKTLAEREAWSFMEREKPSFDLVTFCPTVVTGEPLQDVKSMDKLNTSCARIYNFFDAKEIPENRFPSVVSVKDVAEAHVKAVGVKEAGGKRFILNGDTFSNQFAIDAIRERYPELRERMMFGSPGKSELEGKTVCKLDTTPAQKILGIKFADWYEAIVVQTVPALLRLERECGTK